MSFYHKNDVYLGDSVYLSYENSILILYTYNGAGEPSNNIYMDDQVYDAFIKYVERIRGSDT